MNSRTFEQIEQRFQELRSRTLSDKLPQDSFNWQNLFNSRTLDHLPVGIARLDKNFILREQNRTYADYLHIYSPIGPNKALNTSYFDYMPGSKSQLETIFRETRDQKVNKTLYDYELWLNYEAGKEATYWDANVTPVSDKKGGVSGIIIFCLDTTKQFRALELAKETKSALKVMLDLKKDVRDELEERFTATIHDIVLPLIARLRGGLLKPENRELVDMIESTLFNITSNFACNLASPAFQLTPREVLVASLIKAGKTTKEIASMLAISTSSIESHRAHIRHKLGLKNQKVNLRSFLLSL